MKFTLILIFVLALAVRLVYLGADPSILLDSGQVGDEGYWLYNARSLALFGETAKDQFYHDFAVAPLFSFFSFLNFSVFGVGFWQARLVSALAGFLTVFFGYKIATRFGKNVAMLSTVLIAFNVLLLLHNRLAVPESLSILFIVISVYSWICKSPFLSGASLGLALVAKTTAFLYIPSLALIILSDFLEKRIKVRAILLFAFGAIFVAGGIFGLVFLKWGAAVVKIYSTFGVWYKPGSITDAWQNVFAFLTHPFWGSPFIFTIVILAIINTFGYLFDKTNRTRGRKMMVLWIMGTLFLAPLISRLTNARLLALVIPLSILAAQTLTLSNFTKINLGNLEKFLKINSGFKFLIGIVLAYPLAVVAAKMTLAVIKRISGNLEIVYQLPQLSLVFLIILVFLILNLKSWFRRIIYFDIALTVALPLVAFVDVFSDSLKFFGLLTAGTTVLSLFKLLVVLCVVIFALRSKFNFEKIKTLMLIAFGFFTIFGLFTIFSKPSFKIVEASKKLGLVAGSQAILGFWGHELAIENKTKPIYFAPRLDYVSVVNSDWKKYNPEFLLETEIFDSNKVRNNPWSTTSDLGLFAEPTARLDLSRQFLSAKKEFKINVHRIIN